MIKELVHDPMFLAQKSVDATKEDLQVIIDLEDTLRSKRLECVGMAANMIGVKKNIIIVAIGPMSMIMVNPVILKKSGEYDTEEGCLSLLGGPRPVKRYEKIEVEYLDKNFKRNRKRFEGFTAQIIQHEIDHTNGILI